MDSAALVSAGAGLLGVVVGGASTAYSQWRGRLSERYRDQLQNFYSPLLGMRQKIRAKSELRARLHGIARSQYPEIARTASEEMKTSFLNIAEYTEQELREELVPTYECMAKLFTERMYLAEPGTRTHYEKLIGFVEIWKRHLAQPLPPAVAMEIGHTEEELYAFYNDLESNFRRLQKKLG